MIFVEKFTFSTFQSVFELTYVLSIFCYQSSIALEFIILKLPCILMLLFIIRPRQLTILLLTHWKSSLKEIILTCFNSFSINKIVLKLSLKCNILFNIFSFSISLSFLDISFKIISIGVKNSNSSFQLVLWRNCVYQSLIREGIDPSTVDFAVLHKDKHTFH